MSDINPLRDILSYNGEDEVCINLENDIKVFFKMDDSFLVTNDRDNNCIAIAGEVENNKTRMFSLHCEGIEVHHNSNDCLGVKIIEKGYELCDNIYTSSIPYVHGTIVTISNYQQRMLFNQFIDCDAVYYQGTAQITQEMKNKAMMIMDTCFYLKKESGETEFRFINGLEINQYPTGHTKIFVYKFNASIMMNPSDSFFLSLDNSTIITSNTHLHVMKGSLNIDAINRVIQPYTSTI